MTAGNLIACYVRSPLSHSTTILPVSSLYNFTTNLLQLLQGIPLHLQGIHPGIHQGIPLAYLPVAFFFPPHPVEKTKREDNLEAAKLQLYYIDLTANLSNPPFLPFLVLPLPFF